MMHVIFIWCGDLDLDIPIIWKENPNAKPKIGEIGSVIFDVFHRINNSWE